ncbi:MAG: translation initiation factor [Prevotellaceae bacterium]|jgi:translation initiation factor 1|nr:translation initiation factor [Prevotellaceae bacterium]
MNKNDWKERLNVVYSTNPDFKYETNNQDSKAETLQASKQKLFVSLDKKQRRGKKVTLITGFVGTDEDLKKLSKELKTLCGTGGGAKDEEIIVQGDFRDKVVEFLLKRGYKAKLL